ncbi:hypothetical protein AVEN_199665-1 [Araneus ventricosus]|uniref:Uncharacterized protein n=1 Tax=Araneus ventricosus TaxID=182803 RepID=A0A4Y2DF35_ARAVE|nr:hypothetical protein AVEN_199665-1 [Araneus ventricosus]
MTGPAGRETASPSRGGQASTQTNGQKEHNPRPQCVERTAPALLNLIKKSLQASPTTTAVCDYIKDQRTLISGISPSRELKAVEVSYARACLSHRISPLICPLT